MMNLNAAGVAQGDGDRMHGLALGQRRDCQQVFFLIINRIYGND